MFIQVFRNRVYESRSLKYRIRKLDTVVSSNFSAGETDIVKALSNAWCYQNSIYLGQFGLGGAIFDLMLGFRVHVTHGAPFVNVADVSLSSGNLTYETEFGDLAILVNYILDGELLCSKISILQTKKEQSLNKIEIPLHQQYLMQFWPNVRFKKTLEIYQFHSSELVPDQFAFYHFILNRHVNPEYSSSLCSAPLVGEALNLDQNWVEKQLISWQNKSKTAASRVPAPSLTLSHLSLEPGGIYHHGMSYKWNLLPKPLTQFMFDAAYLDVGTDNKTVIDLALNRIGVTLILKVAGRRTRERELRENRDFANPEYPERSER
jgi:hypothetical protein